MNRAVLTEIFDRARCEGRETLDEIESKLVAAALGFPTAAAVAASTAQLAADAASSVGFPVAVKVLSPDVSHKSGVGGVILGLSSPSEVIGAFERVRQSLAGRQPNARFAGVTVQPMVPAGVEVIAGIVRDRVFGPMLMVGAGGTLVELLDDVALWPAPLDEATALSILERLKLGSLLAAPRGGPTADRTALARLLVALSEMAVAFEQVAEVDLNPVIVHADGLTVADARVRLSHSTARDGQGRPSDDATIARARRQNLLRAFAARRVVVIGDKRAGGFLWLRALARFSGELYSVQIDPAEVAAIEAMGITNCASLGQVPGEIDYAISAVPRQVAPRILRDCIERGVHAVSFFTSGFSETQEEVGRHLEAELKQIASGSDLALIGPNCMGLYNPAIGLCNYPEQPTGEQGSVSFISQSGTHAINFSLMAHNRLVPVNKAASIGNSLILEAADYLEVMVEDPATRAIAMYLESPRDGHRFVAALKRACAKMPVVIWKGGRTEAGARASFSHTASLATGAKVWHAVVNSTGALEVHNLDALFDLLELLVRQRLPHGPSVGLVAMTGGQSVVITDAFAAAGLEIPALAADSYRELSAFFNVIGGSFRNPLDAGGTIGMGHDQARLLKILGILDADPSIDSIVLEAGTGLRASRWETHPEELQALLAALGGFAENCRKTFVLILHPAHREAEIARIKRQARSRGLVPFDSFERAAQAIRLAADYRAFRDKMVALDN